MTAGMTPAERAADTKKRRTRARLIEAGDELLRRETGAGVRVEDIAAAAGVSAATFYNFFPSKTDLVMSLFEELVLSPLDNEVLTLDQSGTSIQARIEWYLKQFDKVAATRSGLVRAAMTARLTALVPTDAEHSITPLARAKLDHHLFAQRDEYVVRVASHFQNLLDLEEFEQSDAVTTLTRRYAPEFMALYLLDFHAHGGQLSAGRVTRLNLLLQGMLGIASDVWVRTRK